MLATYISVRPKELMSIPEGHFDLENGIMMFPTPKEKKMKIVPLLKEDIEILRTLLRKGFETFPFFRHKNGLQYGEKYFYKKWKLACEKQKVYFIDLYGGTRHSSARALRLHCSPEEIRRATMHSTNKAFERYFGFEQEDALSVYQKTRK